MCKAGGGAALVCAVRAEDLQVGTGICYRISCDAVCEDACVMNETSGRGLPN